MSRPESNAPEVSFEDWLTRVRGRIASPPSWPAPGSRDLGKLLFDGILAYGMTSDETSVPPLMALYRHCLEHVDSETRLGLYRELRDLQLGGKSSINTYMPFIFMETWAPLVAETVIDLCMSRSADPSDPLTACSDVCRWIDQGSLANRGAAFGGLLCLGDERVMEMLQTLKWTLSSAELSIAVQAGTGMPTIASVEFWLSWIEELMANGLGDSALMGTVTSGLTAVERGRRVTEYLSVRRKFGYRNSGQPNVGGELPSMEVLEHLSLAEVAARYAPRMYALEAIETPPKLMSDVLITFGLEPRAPVEQRYVNQ
jgi:hypothetical protein